MACACAPALNQLRYQVNNAFPNRDRSSDGCVGDAAHRARKSDHNCDGSGYAHAQDIDEDLNDPRFTGPVPLTGWIPLLLADARSKYVIYERRIYYASCNTHGAFCFSKGGHAYDGLNAHEKHLHLSIRSDAHFDIRPWPMPTDAVTPPSPPPSVSVEVDMATLTTTLLPITFDPEGNGWLDTAGIPWDKIVSVTPHGPNPPEQGYLPLARIGMQERDGLARVTVEGGWPGGVSNVVVKYVTP